jgi:hypothetical protein
MSAPKKIRYGIILILTIVCISGCTLDRITAQQGKATGLWDELIGGRVYGQSFVSDLDNLYRIDLSTATFSRINSAPVIFYLKDSPQTDTAIRSITLPGPEIQNDRPTSFVFEPIPNSAGKSFYFVIESPEATPGNAITVYASEYDQYPQGAAYQNTQFVNGDLAFTAYSRESFTFTGVLGGTASRVAQDVPFFIFYGALILTVIAGLVLTIRKGA